MWLLNVLPCTKACKNLATDGQDKTLYFKLLSSSKKIKIDLVTDGHWFSNRQTLSIWMAIKLEQRFN